MCRKPLIICLAGMPGSGKSIVASVAKEMGLPVVNMGDVIREETMRRYGRITPELMRKVSVDLRKEHGSDVVARRTLEKIKSVGGDVIVVDGVRSLDEIRVFRDYGEVVVVAIHASPQTRFERIKRRGRPGDPSEWSEFHQRDIMELEFGLGNVIALADHMIVNEGGVEELRESARRLFEGLVARARGC